MGFSVSNLNLLKNFTVLKDPAAAQKTCKELCPVGADLDAPFQAVDKKCPHDD